MSGGLIAISVIAAIIAAVAFEYWMRRGTVRPLAEKFNDPGLDAPKGRPALGTEAIDHAAFNRAMRQNEALAKLNGAGGDEPGLGMEAFLKPPLPPLNDETNVTRTEREAMQKD